jgi:predicted metalloprotease
MQFSGLRPADARTHRAGTIHRCLFAAGAACVTLALAGCGSSSSSSSTTSASSTSSSTSAAAAAGTAHSITIKGLKTTGSKPAANATLTALPKAQKGLTAQIQGVAGQPLSQQITTIDGDINNFWGQLFNKAGLQWPSMKQSLVSSGTVSAPDCQNDTTISATDPWRLCDSSSGGTFYFPLTWVGQNVATDQGGVNLLLGMAELWSNHVENLLGVTQAAQSGKIPPAGYAEINVCLSGVYAYSVNDRKLFQAGDQQTFQSWFQQMSPEFTDVSSQDVSTQQLQQAFEAGFKSGNPGTCLPSNGGGGGGTTSQTGTQSTPQTATQPANTQTQPAGGGTGTIPLGGLSKSGG